MQDFDWAAWDKMLDEAHTQEEYHKVIQVLPDYPRPDGYYFIKKGIPPRPMFQKYLKTSAPTSWTMAGMM